VLTAGACVLAAGAGNVGAGVEQDAIIIAVIKIIKRVFFMGLTFFRSTVI
jgi:hypothetical protein